MISPHDMPEVRFLIKRLAQIGAVCVFVGFVIGAIVGRFVL